MAPIIQKLIANNGSASENSMQLLEGIVAATPAFVKAVLHDRDYVIELGKDMQNRHPDLNLSSEHKGFHAPTIRRIFLAESESKNQRKDLAGFYNHEMGHFVDLHVLGNGNWPDGNFSNQMAFMMAIHEDFMVLENANYKELDNLIVRFLDGFYPEVDGVEILQKHFKTIFIDAPRREAEIAAELYANQEGHTSNMPFAINSLFPRSNQLLTHALLSLRHGKTLETHRDIDSPPVLFV